jgi:hypothetical protein
MEASKLEEVSALLPSWAQVGTGLEETEGQDNTSKPESERGEEKASIVNEGNERQHPRLHDSKRSSGIPAQVCVVGVLA